MTIPQSDIIRMAREVYGPHEFSEGGLVLLARFAELVEIEIHKKIECEQRKIMKTPHKHAEVIKAWADGAEIQYRSGLDDIWSDVINPKFADDNEYRVKPEPKPDIQSSFCARIETSGPPTVTWTGKAPQSNLKLTFDGETGKLKSAEVL